MAHQWLRCNLLSADFPLLTDLFGESVAIKGLDEQGQENDAEIFYCENVMPTSAGYNSVGFVNRNLNNDPATGVHGLVRDAYNFSAVIGTRLYRMYLAASATDYTGLYVFNVLTNNWVWAALPGAPVIVSPRQVSFAIVNNQCYICPSLQGVYHFNPGPATFTADALTGIVATALDGITSSNGLMIGWASPNTIVWSSDVNPLDFTPSLVTGAGGGSVGEVKGTIVYCAPVSGGFLIYTTQNVIQASYTGNVSFPFKFQEISSSGGVFNNNQIAFHDNADTQFAWTDKGFQTTQINTAAGAILPKITEFLMAGYYETFDPTTGIFTKVQQNLIYPVGSFPPVINFVASRYLMISYGWTNAGGNINQYDYCLILDIETGRMGKIKFTHVDTLDCVVDNQGQINPTARIGFITSAGVVQSLDLGMNQPGEVSSRSTGLLVVGKFQMQRNKGLYHQRTKMEATYQGLGIPPTVSIMPTLNGKNFLTPVATQQLITVTSGIGIRVFAKKVYGLNISLLVQGPFNLSSLQTDFTIGGTDRSY